MCVTSTSASEDFHFDNISIFDAIRLSDPDIRCDFKNSLWRVTELSVVCVRPEDKSLPAKYPARGHADRDSSTIFFLFKPNAIVWRWKDCVGEVSVPG